MSWHTTPKLTAALVLSVAEVTFSSRKLNEEGCLLPWCESGRTEECVTLLAGSCTPRGDCPGAAMILNQDFTEITFDPDEASGVIYGYRLIGDEIGPGDAWEDCADAETVTRPGP